MSLLSRFSLLAVALVCAACDRSATSATAAPATDPATAELANNENPRCPVDSALMPVFDPRSRIAKALRNGTPVTVVAIGSSSTAGVGASSPARAYPVQLEARMRARWPRSNVRVVNAGVSGQLTAQIVGRFDADVYPRNPDLVILQGGTIEAARQAPFSTWVDTLRAGAAALKARGINVAILDSQYYPGNGATASYQAAQDSMAGIAGASGATLIRRYALMQHLVRTGRYTLDDLLAADRFHPSDVTYECLAHYITRGLNRAVLRGTR